MDIKAVKDEELLQGSDMDILAAGDDEELLEASALRMALSVVNPFLLKCALSLKIPDIISRAGPDASLSVQQIAVQLPSEAPDLDALSRILTYLSTMGILKAIQLTDEAMGINAAAEIMTMKYTLTNLTKTYFASPDISPLSLAPLFQLHAHAGLREAWDNIHERVLNVAYNLQNSSGNAPDLWSYAASNQEIKDVLNAAMVSMTKIDMRGILTTYDGFKDVNTLVNVGGGQGQAISEIIAVYPHIHAINFDLPHVIASAPILPGIEHISGDMFETVPSADAIFMKHVLHLWDDEVCNKLLKMCYKSITDKGKLILAEAVLDNSENCDPIGSGQMMDMVMLHSFGEGRERTETQWNEILKSAGFSLSKIVGTKGSLTKIIEAVKV